MRLSTFIIVLCSSITLSSCALGPRPTLVEDLPVGDVNIVSLLDTFALVDSAEFTAVYRINVNYGNTTATAIVTQGEQERSITIGDTRYLIETGRTRTCDLESLSCSQGLDDTKVSDLQVTHQFWSRATEQRLRIDAQQPLRRTGRIGDAVSCARFDQEIGRRERKCDEPVPLLSQAVVHAPAPMPVAQEASDTGLRTR